MEGFYKQEIKLKSSDEPEKAESLAEKIERAEISVRSMFNRDMEATGVARRVIEDNRLSFSGPEERN